MIFATLMSCALRISGFGNSIDNKHTQSMLNLHFVKSYSRNFNLKPEFTAQITPKFGACPKTLGNFRVADDRPFRKDARLWRRSGDTLTPDLFGHVCGLGSHVTLITKSYCYATNDTKDQLEDEGVERWMVTPMLSNKMVVSMPPRRQGYNGLLQCETRVDAGTTNILSLS
jgi:hypothetical protein